MINVSMYDAAIWYQEVGFNVIPIQPAKLGNPESGKAPLQKWRNKGPLSDPELRRHFLNTGNNIAVETGFCSGLVVVDTDSREGDKYAIQQCAHTGWVVETGGGGRHYWYKLPLNVIVRNRQKINGLGLDLRGDGGYVVAPPSKHYSGRQYRWLKQEVLPEYDPNWFPENKQPVSPGWKIETNDIVERTFRARRYISKIKSVTGEGGDKALFKAACVLIQRFEMEPAEALEELRIWNTFCSDPPWPESRLHYKVQEALRLKGNRNG